MVLSNKKLKQKLRSVLLNESSTQSDSQSQPHESFKSLLSSVTQKPKLNKREIRRVKNPAVKPNPDQENGGVEKESEEIDGGLKNINKKKNNNKRKREEKDGVDKDKGLSDNNNIIINNNNKKKKKKNVKKKKKVMKKDEEGVQKANAGSEEQGVKEESQSQPQVQVKTQISKEDENIFTKIYVGGIPYYSTVEDIQSFFEGCGSITEIDCLKFPETGKFNGIAMISFRTEAAAKRALALDGSDMGGLSLKIQPYKATRDKKVSDFAPAMLEGYNRIYVGNLSWDMTEDELKKFFTDCNISSVRLGKDKETGEFKGFAHVDFADNMSLTMALKLDQKPLFGRPVRVRCAVAPKTVNPGSKVDLSISKTGNGVTGKGKRQTCYVCGEKDHLSLSCPNKKATGSKTDDAVIDTVDADNIGDVKAKGRTCYECGEKGHLSSSCPNKKAADVAYTGGRTDDVAFDQGEKEADHAAEGKIKRRTCYECGEKGHLSSLCPNKKAADVVHTYNRTDDVAFHKDEMEVDNIDDSKIKRRTCYECGEKGHLSSSCPKKQGADVANSLPETFADVAVKGNEEVDYNTVNTVSDGKLKRRTCYECGERGHLSSLCPKKQAADVPNSRSETFAHVAVKDNEEVDYNTVNTVSDGKLRRRTCYECGERGHLSSLCPKKQAADVASSVKEVDDMEVEKADVAVSKEVSEGKLRRRTCYECGERGHLSSLCPKKQAADVANSSKIDNGVAVEEVKTPVAVSDSKLKRRNCYECGLKGHVSSLCPNKSQTSFAA